MAQTPPSLLQQLRDHSQNEEAWRRFDALYRPLLLTWLRRYAIRPQDADDLVQQTMEVVVREIPHFQYDPVRGTFRGWLRGILVNRLREFWRAEKSRPVATGDSDFFATVLEQLADPHSDLTRLWDQEHDEHLVRRYLTLIRHDFAPSTWEAFRRLVNGEQATEIAADLQISVNAVYLAKSSVLKRLRHELEGFSP